LGEYFVENDDAAETAEEATDLIGWVLNHGKVRSIFNKSQSEMSRKVLTFLVANMTCWTTHFVTFDCLGDLKDSMRSAVISHKQEIITAQVGTEKKGRSSRMRQLHLASS
jgi:predicted DNA-binding ArsR family transcriptional regulator